MSNVTQEELNLKSALISTGILIPLESSSSEAEITVMCRLQKGKEAVWLNAVNELLDTAEQADFKAHVCKIFLRRDGKLCAAWNIGIRGRTEDLTKQAAGIVVNVLSQWKPPLDEAEESDPPPRPQRAQQIDYEEDNSTPAARPQPARQQPNRPPRPRTDAEAMQQITSQGRRPALHSPQGMQPLGVRPDPAPQVFAATHHEERRSDGRIVVIDEIPLPHVNGDFNRPSEQTWSEKHGRYIGGGRGAKGVG